MGVDRAGRATKGSQYWIQTYVNERPEALTSAIAAEGGPGKIEWASPLEEGEYAEYYDQDFLDALGVSSLRRPLAEFWPTGGPHWDALGRGPDGDLVLVEAKSHIPEIFSNPTGAGPESRARIEEALKEAAGAFRARTGCDWTRTFYQYANRLAHLYFLRDQNDQPAWLVFVGFLGDEAMGGPSSEAEWVAALQVVEHALGLGASPLRKHVLHVFLPAS